MRDRGSFTTKMAARSTPKPTEEDSALPARMSRTINWYQLCHGRCHNRLLWVSAFAVVLHRSRTYKRTDLDRNQDLFEVGLDAPGPGQGHPLPNDQFRRWAIGPRPLYLNFSDPTILNLQNTNYKADYVVIPQDVPEGGWIYMIIYGNATGTGAPVGSRLLASVAHPVSLIHLHMKREENSWNC